MIEDEKAPARWSDPEGVALIFIAAVILVGLGAVALFGFRAVGHLQRIEFVLNAGCL